MDKAIVKIAKHYAEKVKQHIPASTVVLYGSCVKGTAKTTSDIDIAVVVNDPPSDYLRISADLFELVRGIDNRIEPVLLCRKYDKSGFLANILKYGKTICK